MWSEMTKLSDHEGGFMDNKGKGQADAAQKKKRVQCIVPIMIGQIHGADNVEDFTIYHAPARIVTIVAIVRRIEDTATKIAYDLQDDTGTITAIKWLEAQNEGTLPVVEVNSYARIYGVLREQGGKRCVLMLDAFPLQSLNELTSHLLEIMDATLKSAAKGESRNDTTEAHSMHSSVSVSASTSNEQSENYGISPEQLIIYNLVKQGNDTESGVDRAHIKAKVPSRLMGKVDEILEFLIFEGHIYTTSTDDQFKTT